MKATSRQLCTFYFTPLVPNDDGSNNSEWDCNKCGKTKLKIGGWTNLLNHTRSCVGSTFREDYESLQSKDDKPSSITSFVIRINDAERDMYKWVEWIVMKNQLLSMRHNLSQLGSYCLPNENDFTWFLSTRELIHKIHSHGSSSQQYMFYIQSTQVPQQRTRRTALI